MLYQILIPFLTFFTVVGVGGSILSALAARRHPLRVRLLGLDSAPPDLGGDRKRTRSLAWLAGIGKVVSGKGPSKNLQEELLQAGHHNPDAASIFLGTKAVLFLAGTAGAFLSVIPLNLQDSFKLLLAVAAGFILSLLPNAAVKAQREKRRSEVRLHLADAIDLLEICVSSGMGLDMAWNAVAGEVRRVSPILADEMALTNLEIHLGADRATAMRHMAERTGAEEIGSLVATLLQSEKFGTSIADALKTFAESMRIERSQKAEEAAEKLTVKLIFPMVFFIFPSMLIVCAGAAFIQIFMTLIGGK